MTRDDRRRRAKFPDSESQFMERVAIGQGDDDNIVLADPFEIQGMVEPGGKRVQFPPIEDIVAVPDAPALRSLTAGLICRHIAERQYWHLPLLPGPRPRHY